MSTKLASASPIGPQPRSRGFRCLIVLAFTAVVFVVTAVVAVCGGLWYLTLETGYYGESHGFRVDGSAIRAYQEAQETRPDTHLVVETHGAFVGPGHTLRVDLSKRFDPADHVQLETRGVPLVVEKHVYEKYQILKPIITHEGDDPTKGYGMYFP